MGNRTLQIIVAVLFLVSFGLNVYLLTRENQYSVVEKVVVKEVRDTIHDTIPEVRYEKLVAMRHDTLRVVEKVPGDTTVVVAEVPVSQKEYSDDSTYTAWVSGYKANLDSIDVYRKTVFIDREVTKVKKQKFFVGPYVGYGYDFSSGKTGPTVGICVGYKMFGF
jgi:hypothetical protein